MARAGNFGGQRRSVSLRLAAGLALASAALFGALTVAMVMGVFAPSAMRQTTTESLQETADAAAAALVGVVNDDLRHLELVAFAGAGSARQIGLADVRLQLRRVQESIPSAAVVGFARPDGKILANSNDFGAVRSALDAEGATGGRMGPFVGRLQPNMALATALGVDASRVRFMDLAAPAVDGENSPGILFATLSADWAARELVQAYQRLARHFPGAEMAVFDSAGALIWSSSELPGGSGVARVLLIPAARAGEFGGDGAISVSAVTPDPRLNWTLRIAASDAVPSEHAAVMRHSLWVAGAASALIAFFVGWRFATRLTQSLEIVASDILALNHRNDAPPPRRSALCQINDLHAAVTVAASELQAGRSPPAS